MSHLGTPIKVCLINKHLPEMSVTSASECFIITLCSHDDSLSSKTQGLYGRLLETQDNRDEFIASHFEDVWNTGDLNEDPEGLTRRDFRV